MCSFMEWMGRGGVLGTFSSQDGNASQNVILYDTNWV